MSEERREELITISEHYQSQGSRTIAVARRHVPIAQHYHFELESDLEFIGFVLLSDIPKPSAKEALFDLAALHTRIIVLTGDTERISRRVASEIGFKVSGVIRGVQLERMSDAELKRVVEKTNVFAEILPGHKLRIVETLRRNGHTVGFLGDGVNDAPALRAADVGISFETATDVAREAADLVLLNDDFSSIVAAVRLGRRIFDNLKKAIAYIFAVHVPIAGMSLLPVLFHLPLVLLPAHIAFLELIIDPACSTVFEAEPEEKGLMKHPPRNLGDKLFSRRAFLMSFLQGVSVLAVVFIVFIWALYIGKSETEARTLAFTSLVFANLMLIFTNLSWTQSLWQIVRNGNRALWFVVVGALIALLAVLYLPFLRDLFHFQYMHLDDLVIAIFAGIASLAWFEGLKYLGKPA